MVATTLVVAVLTRETLLLPALATHTLSPVTASAVGVVPTVKVATTVFDECLCAAPSYCPSWRPIPTSRWG